MNIKLLQQVEDLKQIKNDLWLRLNGLIMDKANKLIINAVNNFEEFFEKKNFKIQKSNTNIVATYGNLKVDMKFSPATYYLDSYPCFYLNLFFPEIENFRIVLFSDKPNSSVILLLSDSDKESLNKNIETLKNEIEKMNKRIENLDNEQWVLSYESGKEPNKFSNEFHSMYKLLENILS